MAIRLDLSTVVIACAVVGAAAFAIGRGASSNAPSNAPPNAPSAAASPSNQPVLPAGHPVIAPSGSAASPASSALAPQAIELAWTAPPRWVPVQNPSSMRLATYKIPRAAGDTEDAELTVMQAGGSLEANIDRWAAQFGEEGKKSLKRRQERIAGLDVTIVELEGTFEGGMGKDAHAIPNAALLGAIVPTPGSAHFFKMVGPARTVQAARDELRQLVASLTLR